MSIRGVGPARHHARHREPLRRGGLGREASAEADGHGRGDSKNGMTVVSSGLVYKPNSHTSTVLENFQGDTSHEKFLYT